MDPSKPKPNNYLAAIMGTGPQYNPFLQAAPTPQQFLSPEPAPARHPRIPSPPSFYSYSNPFIDQSPMQTTASGRPRRAAAPTSMPSMGPPISVLEKQAREKKATSEKRKRSPSPPSEDDGFIIPVDKRQNGLEEIAQEPQQESEDDNYEKSPTPERRLVTKKNKKRKYTRSRKGTRKYGLKSIRVAPSKFKPTPPPAPEAADEEGSPSLEEKTVAKKKSGLSEAKRKAAQANALLGRKGKGRPIPSTIQESDPADLMMWQWRHAGRSWDDIKKEYVRITGTIPGRSSLSVRLAKMEDNFIDNGGADDVLLIKIKDDVEKELETMKWQKVAARMKAEKGTDINPNVLRKRYNLLQEGGWMISTKVKEDVAPADAPQTLGGLLASTHGVREGKSERSAAVVEDSDSVDGGDWAEGNEDSD